jgi:hypothetical protein
MDRVARPRRYPRDARLSDLVDRLQAIEEEMLATGDLPNAERAGAARLLIVDMAMGVRR